MSIQYAEKLNELGFVVKKTNPCAAGRHKAFCPLCSVANPAKAETVGIVTSDINISVQCKTKTCHYNTPLVIPSDPNFTPKSNGFTIPADTVPSELAEKIALDKAAGAVQSRKYLIPSYISEGCEYMQDNTIPLAQRTATIMNATFPYIRGLCQYDTPEKLDAVVSFDMEKGWCEVPYSKFKTIAMDVGNSAITVSAKSFAVDVRDWAIKYADINATGYDDVADWDLFSPRLRLGSPAKSSGDQSALAPEVSLTHDDVDEATVSRSTGDGWVFDVRDQQFKPVRKSDKSFRKVAGVSRADIEAISDEDYMNGDLRKALANFCPNDPDMVEQFEMMFAQAALGGAMHRIYVLRGPGGNGKSFLIQMFKTLFGDFAEEAPDGMYMQAKNAQPRHPTELLHLERARVSFVGDITTIMSDMWNLERIKKITGGDIIKVRGMGENFRPITPRCLIVVACNRIPDFNEVTEAVRRRFEFIPFEHKMKDSPDYIKDPIAFLQQHKGHLFHAMVRGIRALNRVKPGSNQTYLESKTLPRAQCMEMEKAKVYEMADPCRDYFDRYFQVVGTPTGKFLKDGTPKLEEFISSDDIRSALTLDTAPFAGQNLNRASRSIAQLLKGVDGVCADSRWFGAEAGGTIRGYQGLVKRAVVGGKKDEVPFSVDTQEFTPTYVDEWNMRTENEDVYLADWDKLTDHLKIHYTLQFRLEGRTLPGGITHEPDCNFAPMADTDALEKAIEGAKEGEADMPDLINPVLQSPAVSNIQDTEPKPILDEIERQERLDAQTPEQVNAMVNAMTQADFDAYFTDDLNAWNAPAPDGGQNTAYNTWYFSLPIRAQEKFARLVEAYNASVGG